MLKAAVNSLLSVLMVVTLLWGGCISCPRFFMFPQAEKDCCDREGQCERPGKTAPAKECKQMPLELGASGSAHIELAAVAVVPVSISVLPLLSPPAPWSQSIAPVSGHSPPDLTVVNSTFLI